MTSALTNRELLTLAAKAAGIRGKWGQESYIERHWGFIPQGWLRAWSPHRRDDDSFELMAALPIKDVLSAIKAMADDSQDYEERKAQIRLAIVRTAAEIGRSMK